MKVEYIDDVMFFKTPPNDKNHLLHISSIIYKKIIFCHVNLSKYTRVKNKESVVHKKCLNFDNISVSIQSDSLDHL